MTIELREVTRENLREVLRLKVAPEQEQFVAPNAVSIAQAYFHRDTAWFRAIYDDDTPVGFVMLDDDRAKQRYFLWRFMIDARFQRKGFGPFYEGLGFTYTGELDEGERVMRRPL